MRRKAILLSNIVDDHQLVIKTVHFVSGFHWTIPFDVELLSHIDESAGIDDKVWGVEDSFSGELIGIGVFEELIISAAGNRLAFEMRYRFFIDRATQCTR